MTTYIDWKPYYGVGEPDAQHKQIIGVINELYAAMEQGNDHAMLKPLLNRLVQFSEVAFQNEERIMQRMTTRIRGA